MADFHGNVLEKPKPDAGAEGRIATEAPEPKSAASKAPPVLENADDNGGNGGAPAMSFNGPKSKPYLDELLLDEIDWTSAQVPRYVEGSKTVSDYREAVERGAVLPPPEVYKDSSGKYHGVDGRHRYEVAKLLGKTKIFCYVTDGELREAKLAFAASNQEHGLQRSNAQKRAAVTTVLVDEQGYHWTDSWTSDHCGVSNTFVSNLRGEFNTDLGRPANHPPIRYREDGQKVNISAIGSKTVERTSRKKRNTAKGGQAQSVTTSAPAPEPAASAAVATVVPALVVAAPTGDEDGGLDIQTMSTAEIRALACKRAFDCGEDAHGFVMGVIDQVKRLWNLDCNPELTFTPATDEAGK